MKRIPAQRADWGHLGQAMKALPNDAWREFVYQYLMQPAGYGALSAAARLAGFGKNSTPENLAKIAWRMSRDERMIAAIAEESQKIIRVAGPEAANALVNLIRDPTHREHGRAVQIAIDRFYPAVTRHDVNVTHKVLEPDQEALEELRALRALGTAREKLIELFGGNGLDRLERLEAADNARRADNAKLIESNYAEVHDGQPE